MLELWRCRLVFESLGLVAFDRPMGLISRNRDDPDALTVFQNTKHDVQICLSIEYTAINVEIYLHSKLSDDDASSR